MFTTCDIAQQATRRAKTFAIATLLVAVIATAGAGAALLSHGVPVSTSLARHTGRTLGLHSVGSAALVPGGTSNLSSASASNGSANSTFDSSSNREYHAISDLGANASSNSTSRVDSNCSSSSSSSGQSSGDVSSGNHEDHACGWYRTILTTIAREGSSLMSPIVKTIPIDQLVHVVGQSGRRVKVDVPVNGWMSLRSADGLQILKREEHDPKVAELATARGGHFRLSNGTLVPAGLQLATEKLKDKVQEKLKDKVVEKVPLLEGRLAHAAYSVDEERVAKAAQRLRSVERSSEKQVGQAASVVLDAEDAGAAIYAVGQTLRAGAEQELSQALRAEVKIPEKAPERLVLPTALPEAVKVPSSEEYRRAIETGPKRLAEEFGNLLHS